MRYYGCKNKLIDFISTGVKNTGRSNKSRFFDLFSGTTTVARHFKQKGFTVFANDMLEFSYALAKAYIETNNYPLFKGLKGKVKGVNGTKKNIEYVINYLNSLKPLKGFIYHNYCPSGIKNREYQRQYFSDQNGKRIDAIRTTIEDWKKDKIITFNEFYILLTALIEAVPYVANISGNYAAYLKKWDPRALKALCIKVPSIPRNNRCNKAFKENANILIRRQSCDILYLDPPYNERQYAANYFLLELIAEGWFDKKPQIYGKTGMRPYNEQKSSYCKKNEVKESFRDLILNADTKYILLSYNDEGLLGEEEIMEILSIRGKVKLFKQYHRRYRSINQDDKDRRNVIEKLYFLKVER